MKTLVSSYILNYILQLRNNPYCDSLRGLNPMHRLKGLREYIIDLFF